MSSSFQKLNLSRIDQEVDFIVKDLKVTCKLLLHIYVCMYACMYVCMYVHMLVRTYVHLFIHTCVCVCVRVCVWGGRVQRNSDKLLTDIHPPFKCV